MIHVESQETSQISVCDLFVLCINNCRIGLIDHTNCGTFLPLCFVLFRNLGIEDFFFLFILPEEGGLAYLGNSTSFLQSIYIAVHKVRGRGGWKAYKRNEVFPLLSSSRL